MIRNQELPVKIGTLINNGKTIVNNIILEKQSHILHILETFLPWEVFL